ncbi:MAG TPA: TIGR03435 family protein [Acidobacteriaceae bacterium]|nr:TIGR03435 family protein [Acidobacteriaceae bacterium]
MDVPITFRSVCGERKMRLMPRRKVSQRALRGAGIGFACVTLLTATASVLAAQEKLAATPAQPANSAQPVQHDYRFEVASVRINPDQTGLITHPGIPSYTPGHYRSETDTIAGLAFKAYGRKQGYEMKYPEWMGKTHFTINATIPDGATKDDLPVMFRHLLEDRFDLKVHHETRQMDGFQLIVAKSGAKLTPSSGTPDPSALKGNGFDIRNGVPQFSKDSRPMQLYVGSPAGLISWWHGRDETMERLASDISSRLKVPVSDATGLEGKYDFSLNFIEERSSPAASNAASTPSDYAPLPDALVQQLGLKLKPVKNIPVDVVVLDSANRQPTEN